MTLTHSDRRFRSTKGSGHLRAAVVGVVACLGTLLLLLLANVPRATAAPVSAPPVVTAVSPDEAFNYQPTHITITGIDFAATPTVTLGGVVLPDVGFVDSGTLTATIPADLLGGTYPLTVTNPGGESSTLSDAFTVLRSRDGSLGPWQVAPSLLQARSGHAAVQARGFVYVLGGHASQALSIVERAPINADGSLGAWQIVSFFAEPASQLAAVVVGDFVYVLGGHNQSGPLRRVERASINPDGSLGPWHAVASMTVARYNFAAVAVDGSLYALGGGWNRYDSRSSVERATVNPDGSLSAWQPVSSMTVGRPQLAAVAAEGYLYAVGGDSSSVERARINLDGSLGSWETAGAMLSYRRAHVAVVADGYLFALGGWASDASQIAVMEAERAPLQPDGSLGAWQEVSTRMTRFRGDSAVVTTGDFVYLLGGSAATYYDPETPRSVEWASISSLVLENLAPSILHPDASMVVTATGRNFLPGAFLSLDTGETLSTTFVSTRTLQVSVPAGLATRAYTATVSNPDERMASLARALTVDGVPPSGGVSINGGADYTGSHAVVLSLSGVDEHSRVAGMTFSHDGSSYTSPEPYQAKKSWTLPDGNGTKIVYTRFLDAAGNPSAIVSDTIFVDATTVPSVTDVSPDQVYDYGGDQITIHGTDFLSPAVVRIGNGAYASVTFQDSQTLVATVPAALSQGTYPVTVINWNGLSDTLEAAIEVLPTGNGRLGRWQPQPQLITPRQGLAVVRVGGYVYALGGHQDGPEITLQSVERAAIQPGGTLGRWERISSMKQERARLSAAAVDGYLYAFGGLWESTAERAAINPDGSLGPWELISSDGMPANSVFVTVGRTLYALRRDSTAVSRANINADGTLGTWEPMSPMTRPRRAFAVASAGNYLYALGGYSEDASGWHELNTVEVAAINPDGSLGSWHEVSAMTGSRESLAAVAADGYLYAVGGWGSGPGNVQRAPIHEDGSLGTWQVVRSLRLYPYELAALEIDGYLYAFGGYDIDLKTLSTVERAAISPVSLSGLVPAELAAGHSTTVAISGTNFLPGATLRLGDAVTVSAGYVSTSTVSALVPATLPSGFYSVTLRNPNGHTATLAGALTVDGLPPTGTIRINQDAAYSRARTVSLQLSAQDAHTGVAEMAFSQDGENFTAFEPYAASKSWMVPPGEGSKTIFVRFKDRIGHVSQPVAATIVLDTIAPNGSVVVAGDAQYTSSPSVTLDVEAHDATSGVEAMSFSNDGDIWSSWEPYAAEKVWALAGRDGNKTVRARFRDAAGNVSTAAQDSITLDRAAPRALVVPLVLFQATRTFEVRWSGSDATSGVAHYDVQYRDGSGDWTSWLRNTTATSGNFAGQEGHSYQFRVRAEDEAGNVGAFSDEATTSVDTTEPVGEQISLNGGGLSSTVTEVQVDLAASDQAAGVSAARTNASGGLEVSLSNDGASWSEWQPYATRLRWWLASGDGPKSVYARFRDAAGNVSEPIADTIVLDTTAGDEYSISINDAALYTNQTAVTLTLGAAPRTAAMKVSNDGGFAGVAWEPYDSRKPWTIVQYGSTIIQPVVYVRYRDVDGNVSQISQDDIILDLTPPTGSVAIEASSNALAVSSTTVTLELSASDEVSGIGGMRVSNRADLRGADWQAFVTRLQWELGAANTVYVQFRDNAGNVSEIYSASPGAVASPTSTPGGTPSPTGTPRATVSPAVTRTPTGTTVVPAPSPTPSATRPSGREIRLYLPVMQR